MVRGDDLKGKGKTLNNILIDQCNRKNIPIINPFDHKYILIEIDCTSAPLVGQYLQKILKNLSIN